jgi:hypothetical protein
LDVLANATSAASDGERGFIIEAPGVRVGVSEELVVIRFGIT